MTWVRAREIVLPGGGSGTVISPDYQLGNSFEASRIANHLEFGGVGVQRHAGSFVTGTGTGTTSVTGLGFKPDVIFFATNWAKYYGFGTPNFSDTDGDPKCSWGVSHKDGSQWTWACNGTWYSQRFGRWFSTGGVLTGSYMAGNWPPHGAPGLPAGWIGYPDDNAMIVCQSHDIDGFTVDHSGDSYHDGQRLGYLALKFQGGVSCKVGTFDVPGGAGTVSYTTGFPTKALLLTSAGLTAETLVPDMGQPKMMFGMGGEGKNGASFFNNVGYSPDFWTGTLERESYHSAGFTQILQMFDANGSGLHAFLGSGGSVFQTLLAIPDYTNPTGFDINYAVNDGTEAGVKVGYVAFETNETSDAPTYADAPLASITMGVAESMVDATFTWWYNTECAPRFGFGSSTTDHIAVGANSALRNTAGGTMMNQEVGAVPSFSISVNGWHLYRTGTEVILPEFVPQIYRRR